VTCGVLVALAVHILLGAFGLSLSRLWRDPPAAAAEVRWALAWWGIAAAGFVTAWVTTGILRGLPERQGPSGGQWLLAGLFVMLLAAAGRGSAGTGSMAVSQSLLASVAAMVLAAVAAALATYFASRR
jgi:hypothetical protein